MSLMSLVLRTGAAQFLVQAIGFAGGILVVRLLPIGEYAVYTVLTAALGTLTALADAGIASSVMAQAGRHHEDAQRVSSIVRTGLAFRRKFSVIVGCVVGPVLLYLLQMQGQSLAAAVVGVAVVGLAFMPTTYAEVLAVPLKLKQAIMPLQQLQLQSSSLRVGLVMAALWAVPSAAIALLCAALSQWWLNARLRRLLRPVADLSAPFDHDAAAQIRRAVRRTFPGSLYYCVSAHLNVWLLAMFGSATSVAEIGALGRLAVVFSVLQATVSLILLPRFARLPPTRTVLVRFFLKASAALVAIGVCLGIAAWLLPAQWLWILGSQYSTLTSEVALMVVNGAVALIAGTYFTMNSARGYVPAAYLPIALGIGQTAALLALLDVSTVHGVLSMQIALGGFGALFWAVVFIVYSKNGPEHAASTP